MRIRRLLLLTLFAALLAAGALVAALRVRGRPPTFPDHENVSELTGLTFLTPGVRLFVGTAKMTFPYPCWQTLLYSDGRVTVAYTVEDLVGHVSVSSPSAALAYLQFLTDHHLHLADDAVPWDPVAVAPSAIVKAAQRVSNGTTLRLEPLVTQAEWESLHLSPQTVRAERGGYVVTTWRWTLDQHYGGRVVGAHMETGRVYQLAYRIAPDGRVTERVVGQRELQSFRFAVVLRR